VKYSWKVVRVSLEINFQLYSTLYSVSVFESKLLISRVWLLQCLWDREDGEKLLWGGLVPFRLKQEKRGNNK